MANDDETTIRNCKYLTQSFDCGLQFGSQVYPPNTIKPIDGVRPNPFSSDRECFAIKTNVKMGNKLPHCILIGFLIMKVSRIGNFSSIYINLNTYINCFTRTAIYIFVYAADLFAHTF